MVMRYAMDATAVEWHALKAALQADEFDNGRTPDELRASFENSYASIFAWDEETVVGTVRLLADGVCNAYLIDLWTASSHRRRGIGTEMVRRALQTVPGHHVALFTNNRVDFYRKLGFKDERFGMSTVVGKWLRRSP